jgi:hypothetical protein
LMTRNVRNWHISEEVPLSPPNALSGSSFHL